jgi:hypothetical protein
MLARFSPLDAAQDQSGTLRLVAKHSGDGSLVELFG